MSLLLDLQVTQPDQPRGFISTNGQSSSHVANIVGLAGSALLWGSVAVFAPAPVLEAAPVKVISAAPQFDPTQPQPYFKGAVIQQFQEPPLRTILYARGQDSNEQPAPRVTSPSFAPVQPNPQASQYGYGTQATVAASQSAGGVWGQRLALAPPVAADSVPFKLVTASPQYVEPPPTLLKTVLIHQFEAPLMRPALLAREQDSGWQPLPTVSKTFVPPLLEVPQRPGLYAKGQDSNELLQPGIFKQAPVSVTADALLFGAIRTASPQVPPDVAPLVWRVQIQQFQEPPLRTTLFAKDQESGFQPASVISVMLQVPAAQEPLLRPIIYARAEDSKYQTAPQVHFGAELPSFTPVAVVLQENSGGWLPYIKRTRFKFDYETEKEREKAIEAARVVNQVIERSIPETTLVDAEIALRLMLREQGILFKAIYMQWLEIEIARMHKEQDIMIEEEVAIVLMLS